MNTESLAARSWEVIELIRFFHEEGFEELAEAAALLLEEMNCREHIPASSIAALVASAYF